MKVNVKLHKLRKKKIYLLYMLLYFYLILIIVMTSINPYIKKNITKTMDKVTFIAVTSVIILL